MSLHLNAQDLALLYHLSDLRPYSIVTKHGILPSRTRAIHPHILLLFQAMLALPRTSFVFPLYSMHAPTPYIQPTPSTYPPFYVFTVQHSLHFFHLHILYPSPTSCSAFLKQMNPLSAPSLSVSPSSPSRHTRTHKADPQKSDHCH